MLLSIRIQALLIFCCGLVVFIAGMANQEVISFDSRFYLFALDMWRHGPSWFPMTYHHPYPDYPATSTFLIYLFSTLFGGINKLTAILPSAIAAALTLAMTYLIAALHDRRWGYGAVLFLLFTVAFMMAARSISLDQFITAITTLSFYLIYSAQILEKSRRIAWIFPLLILGFVFRGPLGLVIPAGVICIFYLLERAYKQFFFIGMMAALLLMVCSMVLLLLAYHVGGMSFLQDVWRMELVGRMQGSQNPPFYYYFVESLGAYAISYPVAILMLLGVFFKLKDSPEKKLLLKLFGWVVVVMVGLSIPGDKKMRYILAIAPALALISGYLFVVKQEVKYFNFLRHGLNWFCRLFPLLCLLLVFFFHYKHPDLHFNFIPVVLFLIVMQIAVISSGHRELLMFLLATSTFVGVFVFVYEPINLNLNKTRDFVLQVEQLRHEKQAKLVFYKEGRDGLVIKYLVNMQQEDDPIFIKNEQELLSFNSPALFIATQEHFDAISAPIAKSLRILQSQKIGHDAVVVFGN